MRINSDYLTRENGTRSGERYQVLPFAPLLESRENGTRSCLLPPCSKAWITLKNLQHDDYLFPSRNSMSPHLSTRQYTRIVERWILSAGLSPANYGTHTMRRTKALLIYKRTKNLRAVQLLLRHTKLESTVRYLGIEVDDALEMAELTEV